MKRMLINATQAEERRLAIVDGQKLLDYEIEIEGANSARGTLQGRRHARQASLEACFVDYGEDRHGFPVRERPPVLPGQRSRSQASSRT